MPDVLDPPKAPDYRDKTGLKVITTSERARHLAHLSHVAANRRKAKLADLDALVHELKGAVLSQSSDKLALAVALATPSADALADIRSAMAALTTRLHAMLADGHPRAISELTRALESLRRQERMLLTPVQRRLPGSAPRKGRTPPTPAT